MNRKSDHSQDRFAQISKNRTFSMNGIALINGISRNQNVVLQKYMSKSVSDELKGDDRKKKVRP